MRLLAVCGLLLIAVVLASCGMSTEYRALRAVVQEGVETAIDDRKSFNDTKAKVVTELPCDMSLGAAMRLESERKRAIIIELCGGPPANSQITVEDVARLLFPNSGQPAP